MQKHPFLPLALRAADAAARLGVSLATLRTWVAEGRIRSPYTVGPRIHLFDYQQLLEDWELMKAEASVTSSPNPWDEVGR
jgi:excisionase family DNA binding protein